MSTSRKRMIVDSVSVGTPPLRKMLRRDNNNNNNVETVKFTIYDFKDRTEKRSQSIRSPTLRAHGYFWRIEVFPRGDKLSLTQHETVSCYLFLETRKTTPTSSSSASNLTVHFSFRCKGHEYRDPKPARFQLGGAPHGWKNFIVRDDVIANYLEHDGSFEIECDIQIVAEHKRRVWYPKELRRQDFLVELYRTANNSNSNSKSSSESETTSDVVVFSVGETLFRAHKTVLSLRGKKLYEIAKDCYNDSGDDMPIRIDSDSNSLSADVFRIILEFAYTVRVPDIKTHEMATVLLVAADRYDCVHLKLYVESVIVDKFLTAKNAAAWLVFADSQHHSCCPLLKESALTMLVRDVQAMKEAASW